MFLLQYIFTTLEHWKVTCVYSCIKWVSVVTADQGCRRWGAGGPGLQEREGTVMDQPLNAWAMTSFNASNNHHFHRSHFQIQPVMISLHLSDSADVFSWCKLCTLSGADVMPRFRALGYRNEWHMPSYLALGLEYTQLMPGTWKFSNLYILYIYKYHTITSVYLHTFSTHNLYIYAHHITGGELVYGSLLWTSIANYCQLLQNYWGDWHVLWR